VDDTRRTATEELPFLDVRTLKRDGLILQGHECLEGIAPLTWTRCNFGGWRPWFVCPGCGGRVAILYWHEKEEMSDGELLLCRSCLDLGYQSQREGPIVRAKRRADKALRRLGPHGSRPKGMHHSTYLEIKRDYKEAMEEHEALCQERLARLRVNSLRRRRRRRRRWQRRWRPRPAT
jgi:hypothetical protein